MQRSAVAAVKWGIFLFLAMGIFFLSVPFVDANSEEFPWWVALLSGLSAFAGAFWLLLCHRRRLYSIEVSGEGIRLPAENRWAPWSQLRDLSEDFERQRVDIIDQTGSRFASLEYRLDGFQEALERTMAQITLSPPARDAFERQISSGSRPLAIGVCALMAGVGIWLWLSRGWLIGVLVATILFVAAACNEMIEIRSIALTSEGVVIERRLRTRIVPWCEITGVELSLGPMSSGSRRLEVFLLYRSGKREGIRPFGCNPFHIRARLAKKLAIGHAA